MGKGRLPLGHSGRRCLPLGFGFFLPPAAIRFAVARKSPLRHPQLGIGVEARTSARKGERHPSFVCATTFGRGRRASIGAKTRSAPLRAQASGTPQHQHRDPKQHHHHDPKSDDPQFGWQVHDQTLDGKTGRSEPQKMRRPGENPGPSPHLRGPRKRGPVAAGDH
jgi:hypothetical protein